MGTARANLLIATMKDNLGRLNDTNRPIDDGNVCSNQPALAASNFTKESFFANTFDFESMIHDVTVETNSSLLRPTYYIMIFNFR